MPHLVLKSSLAPYPAPYEAAVNAFAELVNKYIAELQHWQEHDLKAKALVDAPLGPRPEWTDYAGHDDPANAFAVALAAWDKSRLERFEPYPPPQAVADVVASVGTTITDDGDIVYVADFHVENDDPTPKQILDMKKSYLMKLVSDAEAEAISRHLLPEGKRRLAVLRESKIVSDENNLLGTIVAREQMAAMADPNYVAKVAPAEVAQQRTPEDDEFMKSQQAIRDAISAINQRAAETLSDIEDLTTDNIETFRIPSLN